MGGLSNSNENGDMDLTRSNLLEDKTVSENPSTSEKSDSDWSWNSWFSDDEKDNQKNAENNDSTVSEEGNKHQNWTYEAAKSKHESFVREWKNLSQEDMFKKSQIDFIKQGYLKPLLNNLKTIKGLDIDNLNPVLEDVLLPTAVQHGRAADIVKSALVSDKPVLTEDEIINKIYERRSSYVNERKELESKTKQAITQKRYPKERDKAQQWLRELSY